MANFLTVNLNPVIQKTLKLSDLHINNVNRSSEYYTDVSGKGINVTRVLNQLGAESTNLTHLGGENIKQFLKLAKKENISIEYVKSESDIRTCSTLLELGNNTTTEIVEEAKPVKPSTEKRLLKKFKKIVGNFDYVIISGTKAPGYSDKIIPNLVKEAKILNKKVILDIKGDDLKNSLPFKPDIVKPNREELNHTFGKDTVLDDIFKTIAKDGISLIITDGVNPIKYWDAGIKELEVTALESPLNCTGSGDAFTAGLAYALSIGSSILDAVSEGSRCGKINGKNLHPGTIKE